MPYFNTSKRVYRCNSCGKSLRTERGLHSHQLQNRGCSGGLTDAAHHAQLTNIGLQPTDGQPSAAFTFELPDNFSTTTAAAQHNPPEDDFSTTGFLFSTGINNDPNVNAEITANASNVLAHEGHTRSPTTTSVPSAESVNAFPVSTTDGATPAALHPSDTNNAGHAVLQRQSYLRRRRSDTFDTTSSSSSDDNEVESLSASSNTGFDELSSTSSHFNPTNHTRNLVPTTFDYQFHGPHHQQESSLQTNGVIDETMVQQQITPTLSDLHHTVRRQIQLALLSETQQNGSAHFVPTGDVVLLELMEMLDQASCPHHLFENILDWAIRSSRLTDNFSPRSFSAFRRRTFLKVLYRMTGSSPNDDQGITNATIVMENNNHMSVALPYPSQQESGGHEEPHFPNPSWHKDVDAAVALYDRTFLQSRATHPVVSFSFVRQLQELLDTQAYFQDTSLLQVNRFCPWLPYWPDESEPFDDILSAKWYWSVIVSLGLQDIRTKEEWIARGKPFVLPILLYIDKTGTDAMCRYPLEPLLFTIALFRRAMRRLNTSWRHLGFVPDLYSVTRAQRVEDQDGDYSKGRSCRNYHKVLDVLLSEINSIHTRKQGSGLAGHVPIPIRLRFGNEVHIVQCFLPIACVVGDNKSNDWLCCKIASHHISNPRVTRTCDCTVRNADQPFSASGRNRCRFVVEQEIVASLTRVTQARNVLREQGSSATNNAREEEELGMEELTDVHHRYYCRNAFHGLWFGTNLGGIHTATPTDVLHTLRLGAIQRVIDAMCDELGNQGKAKLDNHINFLFCSVKCTGRKAFPRIHFPHGVSNLSNLQAKERVGVALALLLFLITKRGEEIALEAYQRNMSKQQAVANLVESKNMLEGLLMFDAWAGNGPFWNSSDAEQQEGKYEAKIGALIQRLVIQFPRVKGNGWKLQKTHELLHLPQYITMYGSPMNYDSGQGESALKLTAKKPAKNAQKRSLEEFEEQVGRRIHENALKRKARNLMTSLDAGELAAIRRVRQRCNEISHPNDFVTFEDNNADTGTQSLFSSGIGGEAARSFQHNNVRTVLQLRYWYLDVFKNRTSGKVQTRLTQATKKTATTILFPVIVRDALARFIERIGFLHEGDDDDNHGLATITLHGYSEAVRYRQQPGDGDGVTYKKQMLLRTHFNYQGNGPWHDWVLTNWEDGGSDGESSSLYPAKVIAMFYITVKEEIVNRLPESAKNFLDKPLFLLHCCTKEGTMRNNTGASNRSSKITEKYLLEYTSTTRKPIFRIEPIDIVERQCFAFQENPGIREVAGRADRIVRLLKDRRTEWGSSF